MRAGNLGVPTTIEWLNEVLAPGGRVGIDPVSIPCCSNGCCKFVVHVFPYHQSVISSADFDFSYGFFMRYIHFASSSIIFITLH